MPALEEPLKVDVASEGAEVVIVVSGELDPHTAPTLRSVLDRVITDDTTSLVIDVGGILFIDSSGLRVIISAHKDMVDRSGSLTLRSPTPNTLRLLEITGLADHVSIT